MAFFADAIAWAFDIQARIIAAFAGGDVADAAYFARYFGTSILYAFSGQTDIATFASDPCAGVAFAGAIFAAFAVFACDVCAGSNALTVFAEGSGRALLALARIVDTLTFFAGLTIGTSDVVAIV